MEIDAVLEAFKDFEKKGKNDTCPLLEQFLSHVAKTGETSIPWSQFKPYFLFKLEKVMDDFNASAPEQRGPANPNIEYIPFDEMKQRILKIVDGYNGIPFTIQRLCELLTEPKRYYSGTEKFLRGVEKNVMVVSCVYPASDRNVNGPATPRPLNRPKVSLATSLSTNGLSDCVSKEPESTTEPAEEHPASDSSSPEGERTQSAGMKKKHEEDDSEAEQHEVKRLKFADKEEEEEEREEKASSSTTGSEGSPEMPESSKDAAEEEKIDSSVEEPTTSVDDEPSSVQTEPSKREESPQEESAPDPALSPKSDSTTDQPEHKAPSRKKESSEVQDNGEGTEPVSSSSNDGEDTPTTDKPAPASPSSTAELSPEGAAADDNSESTLTSNEPAGEQD